MSVGGCRVWGAVEMVRAETGAKPLTTPYLTLDRTGRCFRKYATATAITTGVAFFHQTKSLRTSTREAVSCPELATTYMADIGNTVATTIITRATTTGGVGQTR